MKKYISILFVFCLLISCEDFLEESPKSEIAVHQFYKTQEDVRSAVNAIYRVGVPARYSGPSGAAKASGLMSGLFYDYIWYGGKIGEYAMELSLNPQRSDQEFYGSWNSIYLAISRANTVLKYGVTAEMPEAIANQLFAEARFFRAFNYFTLVKDFGDVPLILEPIESVENIHTPRTDVQTVYEQILTDLNWALKNGNLSSRPFALNAFRITRGAAETLLAEVHLQMTGYPLLKTDSYTHAAQAARSVIQLGEHKLIEHGETLEESAYNIIRTSDVEREYIYTIEMHEDIATTGWPLNSLPDGIQFPDMKYLGNIGPGFKPSPKFLAIYDTELDLRIQNQQLYYNSIEVGDNYYSWTDLIPWYFFDERATFETARGSQDIKFYRFPLILLIAAESIARTEGVTEEAIGYLADVRSRAYWQTDRSEIVASLSGLPVEAFVEEVWKERLRELALDFKIWDDIRRTRKYPVTSGDNPGEAEFIDVIGADNGWGWTFQEHHLLYPIPLSEMQRNPNLTQNPNY